MRTFLLGLLLCSTTGAWAAHAYAQFGDITVVRSDPPRAVADTGAAATAGALLDAMGGASRIGLSAAGAGGGFVAATCVGAGLAAAAAGAGGLRGSTLFTRATA